MISLEEGGGEKMIERGGGRKRARVGEELPLAIP